MANSIKDCQRLIVLVSFDSSAILAVARVVWRIMTDPIEVPGFEANRKDFVIVAIVIVAIVIATSSFQIDFASPTSKVQIVMKSLVRRVRKGSFILMFE